MAVCYADILLDEICLEGLEGITPESLWIRIEDRLKHKVPLNMKPKFWSIVTNLMEVEFFTLPESRPPVPVYDRYALIYSNLEDCAVNNVAEFPDIYSYDPVPNEFGSCKDYNTRKNITPTIKNLSFNDINTSMLNTLVVVGNADARWRAIAPGIPDSVRIDISGVQYCMLERIGRSRYNGEISTGKNSLVILGEDSKTMSYYRKYLTQQKLITKQSTIFKNPKATFTLLFHLPRFYKHYPLVVHHRMKLLENYFKKNDQKVVLYKDLKNHLLQHMDEKSFKMLMHSPEFIGKVSLNKNTLYREIYPEAPESAWKLVNTGKERKIYTVKLMQNTEEKFEDEDEDEEGNVEEVGSYVIGEELVQQAYMFIYDSKMAGITQQELSKKLGCGSLMARFALKLLKPLTHIVSDEKNRIKVLRFYSKTFSESINKELSNETSKIKTFFDTNENKSNKNESMSEKDFSDIKVEAKNNEMKNINIEELKIESKLKGCDFSISEVMEDPKITSLRKLRRINMIMEELHKKQVIPNLNDLLKYIIKKEQGVETGVGKMDKRSLLRLLIRLEKDGQVKYLQLKVTSQSSHEMLKFLCEPNVTPSHPLIQTTIEQTKSRMVLKKRIPIGVKKVIVNRQNSIGKLNGYAPKFGRMCTLHEFMFYLAYSHRNKHGSPSEELKKLIDENVLLQNGEIISYEETLDMCKFVPPLPIYTDHPEGWILLSDAICRLPLCMFVKLINVNFHVADLQEYLKHPVKKMFLLKHLPETMRNSLISLCQYSYGFCNRVEMLCYVGLVQFGKQMYKDKDKVFVYVNRNAILWDTTSSKAGYHKIEEKEYPVEEFGFYSLSDVKNYWTRVQEIALCTPLGDRYASLGDVVVTQALERKLSYALKDVTPQEAKESDSGYIPGDGCGAAGLDSNIYIHLKRSWSFDHLNNGKVLKKNPMERRDIMINMPRKKRSMARGLTHKSAYVPPADIKQKVRIIKMRKNMKAAFQKCGNDEIDQEALRILGPKRSKWRQDEDFVLFLSKVAMDIMSPGNRAILFTTIRDILHKCNKKSLDKTSPACKRRLSNLTHNPSFVHKVNSKIIEVSQKSLIYDRYYNLYSRMAVNKSMDNFAMYKKKFIEFVNYLMYEKHDKLTGIVLPKTLEDVHKYYIVKRQEEVKLDHFNNFPSSDIRNGIICSLIHSALACPFVKDYTIFSMLCIYRKFPEIILRGNLIKLRKMGMISLKKSGEIKSDRVKINKYTTNYFKLSINYFNNLCCDIPQKIFEQSTKHIKKMIEKNDVDLELLNGGITASLLDLIYSDYVKLDMSVPENILIDPKLMNADDVEGSGNEEESNDGFQFPSKVGSLQILESNPQHAHDKYVMNLCNISTTLKCQVTDIIKLCTKDSTDVICNEVISDGVIHFTVNLDINKNNEDNLKNDLILSSIYQFIYEKLAYGALNKELKDHFINGTFTISQLNERIKELCNKKLVYRLGTSEVHWVSYKYLENWLVRPAPSQCIKKPIKISKSCKDNENSDNASDTDGSDYELVAKVGRKRKRLGSVIEARKQARNNSEKDQDVKLNDGKDEIKIEYEPPVDEKITSNTSSEDDNIHLLPRPWIRPDGVLNIRYMLRLIGAILNYMIQHPTIKFTILQKRFKYIEKQQLHQLLEITEKIGCVKTFIIRPKKVTLWSPRIKIETEPCTSLDEYEDMFVELLDMALTKFSLFKLHNKNKDQILQQT